MLVPFGHRGEATVTVLAAELGDLRVGPSLTSEPRSCCQRVGASPGVNVEGRHRKALALRIGGHSKRLPHRGGQAAAVRAASIDVGIVNRHLQAHGAARAHCDAQRR